jgi:tetratricopeptide (TPR) repeat protein
VVAVAAVLTVALARGGSAEAEQCSGGPGRLAGAWDAGQRALMTRAFAASGRPHAAASAERAAQRLDAYAGSWLTMYRAACLDSARGEQSADLLDRRMACLDRRLDQMRARTALLSDRPEGEVVDRALTIVAEIEPLAPCGDHQALLAATGLPADPARRAEATAIEQTTDRATLDREAGRLKAALDGARDATARARALDHPPILARAAYALGRALEDTGRPTEAEESLHEALASAERAGDDALAADVLIRLIFVVGKSQARFAEGRTLARLAEAALGRAGERADPELRARLLGNLGNVAQEQGQYDEAISLYEQGLRILRARLAPDDARIATFENYVGNTLVRQGRYDQARVHLGTALAIRRKTLGEEHPRTSDSYLNLGVSYFEEGRPDDARVQYLRSLAIRERVPEYAKSSLHNNLGNVETVAGNYPEAIRHHEAALAERRQRLGPSHPDVATSFHNLGSIYLATGELDRAQKMIEDGLALRRRTLGESHPLFASSLLGLGEVLQRRGRAREAIGHQEHAISILSERLGRDHPQTAGARAHRAVTLIDLGRAREALAELEHVLPIVPDGKPDHAIFDFGHARALWATRRSKARALDLAHRARAAFAASHRTRQAAQVDAWLAKRELVSRKQPSRRAPRRAR